MSRIGILNLTSTVGTGGVFQYTMNLIEALRNDKKNKYFVFYKDPEFEKFCENSQNFKLIPMSIIENKLSKFSRKIATLFDFKSPMLGIYNVIKENKIDILIDPTSSPIGFHLDLPYIVVIHDVMHKYYPDFPEYSLKKRILRDLTYKRAANHSQLVVVDSYQTKEDLVRFYKIEREKIKVIPSCISWYIYKYKDLEESSINEIINKYKIPQKFIFYPAQFWHHKNHLRLIESLYLLKKKYNIKIPVIFVGTPKKDSKETFIKIMKMIDELGMVDQILCLGYLTEEEVVALYKRATALVFPSLIGPTNIPPLEAMALGTPVLCSDLFSMPKQIGDAGLLFDPFNIEDMAEKIYRILTDKNLRQELIQKGYERVKDMTLEKYTTQWKQVVEKIFNMRKV